MANDRHLLVKDLCNIGCVKFGEFKLKSGILSPIYFDFRVIVSNPIILKQISNEMWKLSSDQKFSIICGVPYTALPLACSMSFDHNIPMILKRKEAKEYGTKSIIDGKWTDKDECLVIEDVVTTGSSIIETTTVLRNHGVVVNNCVFILNRGASKSLQNLKNHGINARSLYEANEFVDIAHSLGIINADMYNKAISFLSNSNELPSINYIKPKQETYEKKSTKTSNPLLKRLLNIIVQKKSNIVVSVDLTESRDVLELIEKVGPYTCMIKLHSDIIVDFDESFAAKLVELSDKYDFLLFEDRKFADIGSTVEKQLCYGPCKIINWAHIVNCHMVAGDGTLKAIDQCFNSSNGQKGCLIVAEMSCDNVLSKIADYTNICVDSALKYKSTIGFVCQTPLFYNSNSYKNDHFFLHLMAGVNLDMTGDHLGQNYMTPQEAIGSRLADVIVVGRAIYQSKDPVSEVKKYQEIAWKAYQQSI